MNMSVKWSDFSVEAWTDLLKAAKEKGRYLYQTCQYEAGSLVLSYAVMTVDQYEQAVKQMKIESIQALALGTLQACKRETRKLSLSDVFWITEHYLNEQSVKDTIKNLKQDWGKDLVAKITTEGKEVGVALGEILASSQLLSEASAQFYDERVAPHRIGFYGRFREIISLIQDIFHKYRHFPFVKIFEAKGLESRFKGMKQSVEDCKRNLAQMYFNALGTSVIDHAPQLLGEAHTPPPKGRQAAATPILEKASKTPGGETAQKAQRVRNALKQYLGIPIPDQMVEEGTSEDESQTNF